MTPAARVQAAIELLDQIIEAARRGGAPADRVLAEGFRARRYAGSKDRRAIRELVYGAIRACGPMPQSGRTAMLLLAQVDPAIAALFDGAAYGPAPIGSEETAAERGIAPEWLERMLATSGVAGEEAAALLDRAPLDVRVNTLKAARDTIEMPERGEPLAAPDGLRFAYGTAVEQWDAYRDGRIEVQDCGSQLACLAVAAKPGETVIDLCAGAGGKTLALAAAMENKGVLIASDTDRARLSRFAPRAERAGIAIAQTVLLNPGKELDALGEWRGPDARRADAVLIDAPCSGTGTWRRNPEARWRLTEKRLAQLIQTQDYLIEIASGLVRPGGRIVYVTCSLLDCEGPERIAHFLDTHPHWIAQFPDLPLGNARGPGWRLSPLHDGTDGFFVAQLLAPC